MSQPNLHWCVFCERQTAHKSVNCPSIKERHKLTVEARYRVPVDRFPPIPLPKP